MQDEKNGQTRANEIRPGFMIKLLTIFLLVVSLAVFALKLMEYNDILAKQEEAKAQISEYKASIEELEYLLESPMDADYVARIARDKLGLYFPNEIIFYNNYKK